MAGEQRDMTLVWAGESWRAEVMTWVAASLGEARIEITGAVEQPRIRPWSTLLTIPTTRGIVWFKENHPAQSAEAAVVAELARLAPDHVVPPLAVEPERGWLLSPDHGKTLFESGASTDAALWARVVREFADLQRALLGHGSDLEAAGLVALRPGDIASYVERQARDLHDRSPDEHGYVDAELLDRVLDALPRLGTIGAYLDAATPGLLSLEHNDLHANNTFVPRADESTLRFFDFGDSVWAHPFTSINIPVGVMCRDWDTTEDDPRVGQVVDAYLRQWTDLGTLDELRDVARVARLLSRVHRFESWRRLLVAMPSPVDPDWGDAMHYWLGEVAAVPDI